MPRRRLPESELGARLHRARAQQRLTLRALSKRTTISQASLSRFESGKSTPSFSDVCALARALGWPLLYFATGHERTGSDPRQLAAHLRYWGLSDQETDTVIGETRAFEELVVEALSDRSSARLIEAVPALLLRNDFDGKRLEENARNERLLHRVGWASEIAEWIATKVPLSAIRPDALAVVKKVRQRAWRTSVPDDYDAIGRDIDREDVEDPEVQKWLARAVERTPPITDKWHLVFDTAQERFLDRAREILGTTRDA